MKILTRRAADPGRAVAGGIGVLLTAVAFAGAPGCGGEAEGVAEIRLSGSLDDEPGAPLPRPGQSPRSLRGALQLVRDASRDDALSGVLVRIGTLEGGPARLAELRDALLRLRDSGRTVHCHLESATNFSYWFAASSCERLALSPGGSLELTGLATESIYLRDLLESLGLEADVLEVGSHKGAAEFLTLDDMSPETRETYDEMLDDLTAELVDGIAAGRGLEPAQVRDLLDQGPFDPALAASAGLVDAIEYHDQALEALRDALPGDPPVLERYRERHGARRSQGLFELAFSGSERVATGPRVAALYLSGTIADSSVAGGLLGDAITPDVVRRFVEEVRDEPEIRALVVRIDSPGGSAAASDEIWHELMEIREDLPIVVSMGDMAASGGYYIATASEEIFAERGTLTGSIGVVGGKIVFGDLAARIGVNSVLLARGRNAGLASLFRPFSPSQRAALERVMRAIHERFIRTVVEGRGLDEATVRELATGRVWTGVRGRELGLVDHIGGLHDALAHARELGGLDPDAPVEAFPRPLGLLEQLGEALAGPGLSASAPRLVERHLGAAGEPLAQAVELVPLLEHEPALLYCPLRLAPR